jgi:hypothetical protein
MKRSAAERFSTQAGRLVHPTLLVADPKRTFMWDEPLIFFAEDHFSSMPVFKDASRRERP